MLNESENAYGKELDAVHVACQAQGVILMVINGKHGHGFGCHVPPGVAKMIPSLLRDVANDIEEDMKDWVDGEPPNSRILNTADLAARVENRGETKG